MDDAQCRKKIWFIQWRMLILEALFSTRCTEREREREKGSLFFIKRSERWSNLIYAEFFLAYLQVPNVITKYNY